MPGVSTPIRCLTAALAAGDEEAFRQFHSAYFDRLLRYLFVVTRGDEQAAHDALQETFIRVARHARSFEREEEFWSWLTVLARSAAADDGRKRRSYWRMMTRYAFSWLPPPAAPEPEDADERLHALLQAQLNALTKDDRALLEARYLQGLSMRDLAVRFDLTERAAESRLARLRQKLREQLLRKLKDEEAN
jgi:RNA polymerase sigma-70 factor (ECF subfamily)